VTWLVQHYHLERIVYLGDDTTDAHAFRALGVLRQTSGLETLGIGVVVPETPPCVQRLADATLGSVDAVATLLSDVAQRLSLTRRRVRARPGE
jgi:trehalose-6-phosphatase